MEKRIRNGDTAFMANMRPMGMGHWLGKVVFGKVTFTVQSIREVLTGVYYGGHSENVLKFLNDRTINRICRSLKLNYTWPKGGAR